MLQYYYIEDERVILNELIDGFEYLLTKSLREKGLTKKVNNIDELEPCSYFILIDTRLN